MRNPIKIETNEGLIIRNIVIRGERFAKAAKEAFGEAILAWFPPTLEKQISMTCHSLADLRKADHPYAARHFGGSKTPPQTEIPEEGKIHTHTGQLLREVKEHLNIDEDEKRSVETSSQLQIFFDISLWRPTPLINYVFRGTTRQKDGKNIMVARNPGALTRAIAMPFIIGFFYARMKTLARKEFQVG